MNKKLIRLDYISVIIVLTLVSLAVWSRLVPHPANVTALTAVALLAGSVLPKRWALIAPLLAIISSDLIIGLHSLVYVTWGSFAIIALIGMRMNTISPKNVIVASLLSSTLFFIVTNAAVWLEGRMYQMTFEGLMQCYINALPFYRNMLAGDLLYSGVIFGLYVYTMKLAQTHITISQQSLTR
ncbi:MAG: DUF6580 family putative transport protein [Candidatus Saccharimonadales bacterium]